MEETPRAADTERSGSPDRRTIVAFAELLQEWAELPGDGPEAALWGAALAHEMTAGFWRSCNVRVLSSDNQLYRMLIADRVSASLWRNRTVELAARARQLGAGSADEPVRAVGTDQTPALQRPDADTPAKE